MTEQQVEPLQTIEQSLSELFIELTDNSANPEWTEDQWFNLIGDFVGIDRTIEDLSAEELDTLVDILIYHLS